MPYSHLRNAHHVFEKFGDLHVIVPYYNPMRYQSRLTLLHEFIAKATGEGAKVHVVEVVLGERPWEIKDLGQYDHLKLRTKHELWLKENSINLCAARLPEDAQYIAVIDGDVAFNNPHWVMETIQQLQHFPIVQMWRECWDLDPSGETMRRFKSFAACALEDPDSNPAWSKKASSKSKDSAGYYHLGAYHAGVAQRGDRLYWHPGYAWAYTRDAWDALGGLLDINVVGGGDHQMANALYGKVEQAGIPFESTVGYRNAVLAWQEQAARLDRNIGFVPGSIAHYWHGKKSQRGYFDRWQILARNQFDPVTDLRRDWQGLLQLAGNKPQLRDDLRAYFRSRQEDSIDM